MSPPHAAAGVGAGVYIAGAGLVAGAVYLMAPAGQRMSVSFGEAVVQGGSDAVDNIRNLISGEEETQAPAAPTTATQTGTETATCDGPHRGVFQAQGFRRSQEPRRVELSKGWFMPCQAPIRPVGNALISALLADTAAHSFQGAGLRGPAFSRMSRHLASSSGLGFIAIHLAGWGITSSYRVVRNTRAGRDAPRVDLEVQAGRAFGIR